MSITVMFQRSRRLATNMIIILHLSRYYIITTHVIIDDMYFYFLGRFSSGHPDSSVLYLTILVRRYTRVKNS